MTQRVLVTGGSGFIAGHVILQLLDAGYLVRATLRSLDKEPAVRATLAEAGATHLEALTFTEADLLADAGWAEAMDAVDYVMHVASPVLPGHVENEDDVIVPAVSGTRRVLEAARDAGVKRVVLTSAFHAVGYGYRRTDRVFTDDDWAVLDGPGITAYSKAKVLAERAAWEISATSELEVTTILPVAVMGPVMGREVSGSNHIIQHMLAGGMPGTPDVYIPIVDVRDVARAHLLAMTTPDAAGQRFLVTNGRTMPLAEVAATLRGHLGAAAAKVPTRRIPSLVVRLAALFNPEFRAARFDLGFARQVSAAKAERMLGWTGRPPEESIVAAGESLVAKGLVG